jgi:phage repressor protein C with HTH and peptisase S24 domain
MIQVYSKQLESVMDKAKEMAALRRVNLLKWMDKHRLTQTDIAMKAGLSRSYVSLLFNPERFFGEKTARKLELSLSMPTGYLDDDQTVARAVEAWTVPEDLQPGVYALVPRVAVSLSAGNGHLVDQELNLPPLAFRRDWLESKCVTSKNNLRVMDVAGDSMEPYLMDRDVVLIDIGQTEIRDHVVYAIAYDNELRIKRLSRRFDGGLKIRSDNPAYPDEELNPKQAGYIRVIGKMLWRGG